LEQDNKAIEGQARNTAEVFEALQAKAEKNRHSGEEMRALRPFWGAFEPI
jgi:hypothetical protein